MFMSRCGLCGYSIVAPNLEKLILHIIIHFTKSHYKTHKLFTVLTNNSILNDIEKIIDTLELKGYLFRKLRSRKAPYITFISKQYHKQNKHAIFYVTKIDPLDYLLFKQLNKKH